MTIAEKFLKIFKKQEERYKDLLARVEALEQGDGTGDFSFRFKTLYGENITCYADNGMTWADWCDSKYNTVGAYVNAEQENIVYVDVSQVTMYGSTVYGYDTIYANCDYAVV